MEHRSGNSPLRFSVSGISVIYYEFENVFSELCCLAEVCTFTQCPFNFHNVDKRIVLQYLTTCCKACVSADFALLHILLLVVLL